MYMEDEDAKQSQPPAPPISSHLGYSRQMYMYHNQERVGLDQSMYLQRAGGGSIGSPTSPGSNNNVGDSNECANSNPANRVSQGIPSQYNPASLEAKIPYDLYRGSSRYSKESSLADPSQTFASRGTEKKSGSPDSGVEVDRAADIAGHIPTGAISSIAVSANQVATEQRPSSYEVNTVSCSSAGPYQASRYSPMASENATSANISDDTSYSYNAELVRRESSIRSSHTQLASLSRDSAYPGFYSAGYPVTSPVPGQAASHTHFNPYPLPITAYSSSQTAVANGIIPGAEHPDMSSLSHPGTYSGSSEGWNGHPGGYGALDYSRFAMSIPASIPYGYPDGRHCCALCGSSVAVCYLRTDGMGRYCCTNCVYPGSGQMRMPQKSRGKLNNSRSGQICSNCRTGVTTLWRRSPDGSPVCNACGLYQKLHGVPRPQSMKKDSIQTRKRKPKGQGKGKKTQRRQALSSAHHPDGYSNVAQSSSSASSPSSKQTNRSKGGSVSGNSPKANFFATTDTNHNIMTYQSGEGIDDMTEHSAISSPETERIIGDMSNSSPHSEQSACAVDAPGPIQPIEPSSLGSSSRQDSFSPTARTSEANIYNGTIPNEPYQTGYHAHTYSDSVTPRPNIDMNSSPMYGQYPLVCQQQQPMDSSNTNMQIPSETNFFSAATFSERPRSVAENYRAVISGGYASSNVAALAPTSLYRDMQQHQSYASAHYPKKGSSARC